MSEYLPLGYISARNAINAVGQELHGDTWDGREDKAPRFQWPPGAILPSGSGAGRDVRRSRPAESGQGPVRAPDTPEYRREYDANKKAGERWDQTVLTLRQRLESGQYKAAVLNVWTGALIEFPASTWRQFDGERMLMKGQATLPNSNNLGRLLIADFRAPPAMAGVIKSETACQRWLAEDMRANLEGTSTSKNDWMQSAKQKFPRLSDRGFKRAWDSAIKDTGASAWKRASRKCWLTRPLKHARSEVFGAGTCTKDDHQALRDRLLLSTVAFARRGCQLKKPS